MQTHIKFQMDTGPGRGSENISSAKCQYVLAEVCLLDQPLWLLTNYHLEFSLFPLSVFLSGKLNTGTGESLPREHFLCQNICYSKMKNKTAVNLWEVHGISGPVVHQFMEVICEGSFPLVGSWHVGRQTLRTSLALTQTTWTAHCIGAISPCGGRHRGGGEEQRMWDIVQIKRRSLMLSEWMRMHFQSWTWRGPLNGDRGWFLGSFRVDQHVNMVIELYCLVVMMEIRMPEGKITSRATL